MPTRDQIFAATDLKVEIVPCPEWGGDVTVTTMQGAQRDQFEAAITDAAGKVSKENIRARLLVRCIVDEKGNRVFSDDDAATLGTKSARVLDRLFTKARELNGLSKEDVEELAKN